MSIITKTLTIMLILGVSINLALVELTFAESSPQNSWIKVTTLPTNTRTALVTVLKGSIYSFSGPNEKYDPKTDSWTQIASAPFLKNNCVAAYGNKIYLMGGDIATQVYDPLTDTWTNKTAIPKYVAFEQANVVNDKIYLISGGYLNLAGIHTYDTTYVYDPASNSWSTMASIPTPTASYASAVLDGKIYIIGGGTNPDGTTPQNASNLVQIFDPETNNWSTGKPLPSGVFAPGACSTSGFYAPKRIYVLGGSLEWASSQSSSFYLHPMGTPLNQVYDLQTDSWSVANSLPDPRWYCSLINVNDVLYAVGGDVGDPAPLEAPVIKNEFLAVYKYIPLGYEVKSPDASSPSPTSAIPELSWLIILPLLLSVFSVALVFRHRKQVKKV